jgi:hypothetical protein
MCMLTYFCYGTVCTALETTKQTHVLLTKERTSCFKFQADRNRARVSHTFTAMTAPSLSMRVAGGRGRIAVQALGPDVSFSELSASYPLKLLSTRVFQEGVAIVYILTYGGGLVGGDVVDLHVDIGPGCKLLLLTQVHSPRNMLLRGE